MNVTNLDVILSFEKSPFQLRYPVLHLLFREGVKIREEPTPQHGVPLRFPQIVDQLLFSDLNAPESADLQNVNVFLRSEKLQG